MKFNINLIVVSLLIITISSCSYYKKNDYINIKIESIEGGEDIRYYPKVKFKEPIDSARFLYNESDLYKIFNSKIYVTEPIYKSDAFQARIFQRKLLSKQKYEYGFLLRTYSKDGKIKDEMVLASTLGDLVCSGRVTEDLKIITDCPNHKEVIAQIEKDGSITKLKDD